MAHIVPHASYILRNAQCARHAVKLLLLLVFLSGCVVYRAAEPAANYYYLNPYKDLSAIGRTAFVELDNESSYPQISADVTEALFQALQKKQLFGLTIVHKNDPLWHSLQSQLKGCPETQNAAAMTSGTVSEYNLEQLSAIRKTLKCNAILTGTITQYRPYPHLTIGLRLKLIDLRDGQLLWALEQVWDSTDKTTERRIRNYYSSRILPRFASLGEQLGVVSSLKFIKFVGYEVARTL